MTVTFEQMPKGIVKGTLVSCTYMEVDRGVCVVHTYMYLNMNRTGS